MKLRKTHRDALGMKVRRVEHHHRGGAHRAFIYEDTDNEEADRAESKEAGQIPSEDGTDISQS